MGPRRLEIFRTPRHGYTDYAVGWLFAHVVTLPTALIVAADGGIGFGVLFACVFLGALVRRRGIVNRCLRHSPFYRWWLVATVVLLLVIAAPGVSGNLPHETFNTWLVGLLVTSGAVLFVGWYRVIRKRL